MMFIQKKKITVLRNNVSLYVDDMKLRKPGEFKMEHFVTFRLSVLVSHSNLCVLELC